MNNHQILTSLFTIWVLVSLSSPLCAQVNPDSVTVPGVLMISEILFNPIPGGSDYVEIHNNTDAMMPLAGVCLAQYKNGGITKLFPISDDYIAQPGEYFVVTTDAEWVKQNYNVPNLPRLIEMKTMPGYNDASGTVILTLEDTSILDRFDYTASMHSRVIQDVEGVALERRSFSLPTQMASNWTSASSVVGYGTPTYKNSQSQELLVPEEHFLLSSNVFSPNNDGYQDLLDISYQLEEENLLANIIICDLSGRTIRHLLRNGLLGNSGVVTWDGTDDVGFRCRPGSYVVLIEVYSTTNQRQVIKLSVALRN